MKKPPKIVLDIVRGVVGLGVAAFLIHKVVISSEVTWESFRQQLSGSNHWLLALALLAHGAIILLTAWRWQMLLAVQGIHLPLLTVARLTMIGVFFSLLIPGAVGGDLIKMVYASKRAPSRGTEAVMSIMLDRVMGLLGLCLVTLIAVLFCIRFVLGDASQQIQLAVAFVGLASLGAIVVVLGVYFRSVIFGLPGFRGLLQVGRRKLPEKVTAIFERLAVALDLYREQLGTLVKTLAISCLVHTVASFMVFLMALAYGMQDVAIRFFFFATQLANAIGAIPLAPMGSGQRDYVLAKTLEEVGTGNEIALLVALTLTFVMVLWALFGGIVFMFSRIDTTQKDVEALESAAAGEKPESQAS